jgi:maleate isomerase
VIRLGMLTPSSNTVLEPVCAAMLRGVDDVSVHFSRFRVVEIGLGSGALGQFDSEAMLAAADLLADARVDVICWNGTSAGWLGLESDERLCEAITRRTGVRPCTAVLALNALLRRDGRRRLAFLTPYTDDVQGRIVDGYRPLAASLEAELGIAVYDTVATAMFGALEAAGADPTRIGGFGAFFAGSPS